MTHIVTLCDTVAAAIKNTNPSEQDRKNVSTLLEELTKDENKNIVTLLHMQHVTAPVKLGTIQDALKDFAKGEDLPKNLLSPSVEYLLQIKKAAELAASGAVEIKPYKSN